MQKRPRLAQTAFVTRIHLNGARIDRKGWAVSNSPNGCISVWVFPGPCRGPGLIHLVMARPLAAGRLLLDPSSRLLPHWQSWTIQKLPGRRLPNGGGYAGVLRASQGFADSETLTNNWPHAPSPQCPNCWFLLFCVTNQQNPVRQFQRPVGPLVGVQPPNVAGTETGRTSSD